MGPPATLSYVRPVDVKSGGEDQRRRPHVDWIDDQRLTVAHAIGDQPDDEPNHGQGIFVSLSASRAFSTSIGGYSRRNLRASDDHDWPPGVVQHPARDTAEQRACDRAVAARPDDDQICVDRVCVADDRIDRIARDKSVFASRPF